MCVYVFLSPQKRFLKGERDGKMHWTSLGHLSVRMCTWSGFVWMKTSESHVYLWFMCAYWYLSGAPVALYG